MSQYIVKTIFHFQDKNDATGQSRITTAFQVFEFKDLLTAESEVIEYCKTIFSKGSFKRIVDITVLNLPMPANFPYCEFLTEVELAAITNQLTTNVEISPENHFKQFLVEVIEKTVRQFQSSKDEMSNSLEKILYPLVLDENDSEEEA
jgi:hypothetical protein